MFKLCAEWTIVSMHVAMQCNTFLWNYFFPYVWPTNFDVFFLQIFFIVGADVHFILWLFVSVIFLRFFWCFASPICPFASHSVEHFAFELRIEKHRPYRISLFISLSLIHSLARSLVRSLNLLHVHLHIQFLCSLCGNLFCINRFCVTGFTYIHNLCNTNTCTPNCIHTSNTLLVGHPVFPCTASFQFRAYLCIFN